jgi:hypothetical protein
MSSTAGVVPDSETQEGTIPLLELQPYGRAWNRWRPVQVLFGWVQLYNLYRVFKPIAIVHVHWLWTVFWSLNWLVILFLCFFSPPTEWARLWLLRCGDRSRWAPHHRWEMGAGSRVWSGALVWYPWAGCGPQRCGPRKRELPRGVGLTATLCLPCSLPRCFA